MCLAKSRSWKPIKPHRTVMILEKNRLLQSLYTQSLEEHNWRVISCVSSSYKLLQKFQELSVKPDLLILDYDDKLYPELVSTIYKILQINPFQYLVFVSSEERLLRKKGFFPPFLHQVPVILKFTHSVEDLVEDLDILPDYEYPLTL